jgi:hypothetical protein
MKVNPYIKPYTARCQWLTPIIIPTQEAEIGRITGRDQTGQNVEMVFHTMAGYGGIVLSSQLSEKA